MAVFKFKAISHDDREISGVVEAENESVASGVLNDKGFKVLSLKETIGHSHFNLMIFLNRIKPKEMVIFSRQFAVMVSASVSIVDSLKILARQTENIKFKKIIFEISEEIDNGAKLSETLAKRPKLFSSFYVSVVSAGEKTGKLDDSLNYLADELEKDYDIASKIKGAMIYPAVVITGMFVIGMIMMIFVVPKLTQIFSEVDAELPLMTRLLIGTSDFLVNYWWIVIGAVVAGIIGFKYYAKQSWGKAQLDYLLLKTPVFGNLFSKIYIVRFARSMNTLIVGGVTIIDSLRVAAEVVGNTVFKNIINKTISQVEDGNSISIAFLEDEHIPKMVGEMMYVGEKTGKLDVVLDRVTIFYSRELEQILDNLMALIEPFVMVVMGVGVGILAAAVLLPMYQITNQI